MGQEVSRAVKQGFTAEELEKARAGLLEYRQAARSQDGGLARQLAGYLYLGRTLAFDATLEAKLAKLKPEDVRKAMERHVDWARVLQVKAGDFANVEKKAKAPVNAPAAP
jgi:zinc protease